MTVCAGSCWDGRCSGLSRSLGTRLITYADDLVILRSLKAELPLGVPLHDLNGVDWAACENALTYLRGSENAPFGYYHDTDLIEGRPAGVPLHCISIDASPTTGLILGYGEYFGFHRLVCLLGEDYRRPAIRNTYAIDPRTGTELDLLVLIPFSREDIDDIYAYRRTKLADIKRAADAILGPAMQARMDAERKRVTSEAIDEAFASCGAKPGEMPSNAACGFPALRPRLFLAFQPPKTRLRYSSRTRRNWRWPVDIRKFDTSRIVSG